MRSLLFVFLFLLGSVSQAATTLLSQNSSTAILTAGSTFTGAGINVDAGASVICSVKTDQAGTLYMEFSPDNSNWDSSLSFSIAAGVNELHRLSNGKRFFRSRFTNTSASPQTYFRLQCLNGEQPILTSALNAATGQDADAVVTKSISEEILIAEGKFQGYSIVNKFGLNPDIDSGATTEDIWGGDGVYTGWATSAETAQVVSSSANDTAAGTGCRSVRIIGLDANYAIQSETIATAGTGTSNGSLSFIRVHTASCLTAGSGGVNAGAITIRQSTTTANVFLIMAAGRNQSNCSCYTVPAGKTAYMRNLHVAVGTAANVAIDGNIWTRPFGGVFRSRRPYFASDAFRMNDVIYGGLVFTEKSDIILRNNSCSANNTPVNGGYDLVLVDN